MSKRSVVHHVDSLMIVAKWEYLPIYLRAIFGGTLTEIMIDVYGTSVNT